MSCRHVACIVATLLAACGPAARPDSAAPSRDVGVAQPSAGYAKLENEVFELVNRHRVARGLRALVLDARVAGAARLHSARMASGKVPPGHEGFRERVGAIRATCRRSAENVAFNHGHQSPGAEAVRSWLESRGHRTNIEGPYDVTGVGVASSAAGEVYFTQIFLGECPRS